VRSERLAVSLVLSLMFLFGAFEVLGVRGVSDVRMAVCSFFFLGVIAIFAVVLVTRS